MVLADEHQQHGQRCSNSNGSSGGGAGAGGAIRGGGMGGGTTTNSNSRSGKKQKQDKVPQRGLGVAELERILRDQQKSTTAAGGHHPPCNPAESGLTTVRPPPPHLLRRPLPALGPVPEPSSSLFKPPAIPIPSPKASPGIPPPPPPPPPTPDGGVMGPPVWGPYQIGPPETGIPGLPPPVHHYSDGLPDHVWLPHGYEQQRRSPVQQQPLPYPMVSISPPTSGANLQMEPPSNQINISSSSNLLPPWPDEDRIVGMRHQWSFPFEGVVPPGNSYLSSKPPPFPRPEELPSIQGLETLRYPLRSPNVRDGPSGTSTTLHQGALRSPFHHNRRDKSPKENGPAKGETAFLGSPLVPAPLPLPQQSPVVANPSNSSRAKQPMMMNPTLDTKLHEIPDIGSLHSFYAHLDGTLPPPQFTAKQQLQTTVPPYYNFFPMKVDACETASTKQGGTPGDHIDLELKL